MKKLKSNTLTKVVAAVIEKDGKVLIARRREAIGYGGLWEFPGGRLEEGETVQKGLEREIAEELGVRVRVGELVKSVIYRSPKLSIVLQAYHTILLSEDFKLSDHDEIRWVEPSALEEMDFTEPDRPVVRQIKSRGHL